jgi:hypothetical protein
MSRRAWARRYEISESAAARCVHSHLPPRRLRRIVGVKFTGPVPQMAITTASLWLLITPS